MLRINRAGDVGEQRGGSVRRAPDFTAGDQLPAVLISSRAERPQSPRCRIDNVGKPVDVLRPTCCQSSDLVSLSAVAERRGAGIEIVAQGNENGGGGVPAPHPAGADQHLVRVLRVEDEWSVESALIDVPVVWIARDSLQEGIVVVAGDS